MPSPSLHCSHWTCRHAVATMQAVFLLYHKVVFSLYDAVLRTHRHARAASYTCFCYEVTMVFLFHIAKSKARSFNRLFRQVKIFACTFIDLEHRKRMHGFFGRIDLMHIRILFEQLRNPVKSQLLHFAPYGDGHACERIADILEKGTYTPWQPKE